MGMKSLFVQLNNSVVIAFITDHTAKSGILQILTKKSTNSCITCSHLPFAKH